MTEDSISARVRKWATLLIALATVLGAVGGFYASNRIAIAELERVTVVVDKLEVRISSAQEREAQVREELASAREQRAALRAALTELTTEIRLLRRAK